MNRRSREVGFIFIAAIRRETQRAERRRIEQGETGGLTSLGQSVAVVTVNDATSNAVGIFSASISRSLSLLSLHLLFPFSFSVPTYRAPDRHCRLVSFLRRFAYSFWGSMIVWGFYRVSSSVRVYRIRFPREMLAIRES